MYRLFQFSGLFSSPSWNLLNQHSQHLLCWRDTDQSFRFTISAPEQCTDQTSKLRHHFNVNKPDTDWQVGPIRDTTGWHKRRPSNSHFDFQLSGSAIDQLVIGNWWGTTTVEVGGGKSGWVQLMMLHGRVTWSVLKERKALWFCYAVQICAVERKRGLWIFIFIFSINWNVCSVHIPAGTICFSPASTLLCFFVYQFDLNCYFSIYFAIFSLFLFFVFFTPNHVKEWSDGHQFLRFI